MQMIFILNKNLFYLQVFDDAPGKEGAKRIVR